MPRVRTLKTKKYPEGFHNIQQKLTQFEQKIRDAEALPNDAIYQNTKIHHEKSRYFYQLRYKSKEISKELYDFLIDEKYIDKNLIAKWKKTGYQKLCCLPCIQKREHNFQGTCICRVPQKDLETNKLIICRNCGCRGCASTD